MREKLWRKPEKMKAFLYTAVAGGRQIAKN
jgi:hypothetical protein